MRKAIRRLGWSLREDGRIRQAFGDVLNEVIIVFRIPENMATRDAARPPRIDADTPSTPLADTASRTFEGGTTPEVKKTTEKLVWPKNII